MILEVKIFKQNLQLHRKSILRLRYVSRRVLTTPLYTVTVKGSLIYYHDMYNMMVFKFIDLFN